MLRSVLRCTAAAQHRPVGHRAPATQPTGFARPHHHRPARRLTRRSALIVATCWLLALLGALPPAGPAARAADAGDWPQYRHDIQRSGRAGAALPAGADGRLHLQWAYSLGERVEIEVEPIVAAGKVFVGAMNGTLTALNVADGSPAWTFKAGPFAHTAAYADGRVFVGSLDGNVYALDAASGQQVWKFATGGPVYAAPAVAGGAVYIGSTAGRFFALDAAAGTARWRYPAEAALPTAFTGAAALSPDGARVFVGNEDMHARALDAASGALLWDRPLAGVGMRGVHPVVSDDGAVVFFQTTKPGVQSYLPTENYPKVAAGNDPNATWNTFYSTYPERRATFFLRAGDGAELWDKAARRYVPLPLPYWGLMSPVLDGGGNLWFPSPGGAQGSGFGDYDLDHDSRLMRVALGSGAATQVAVRSAFQMRMDENGRATFAGTDYLTTISEDLGVYRTASSAKATLFGNPGTGFGSHMDPLAPLPSKHLWRYGGTVSMGGVPGASAPVVAGGMAYYVSYGWLFALGATDRGKDPTGTAPIAFPARDARAAALTNPRTDAPSFADIQVELEQRVSDLVAAGAQPPLAKFEQAGGPMQHEVSGFQVFGMPAERIWIVAQALPYVSPSLRAQALAYLKTLAQGELFKQEGYAYARDCLVYGQAGVQTGDACTSQTAIITSWQRDNEVLTGERLYAMAAYSEATGDWSLVEANWSWIKGLFGQFSSKYDGTLGFAKFEKWHVGKLSLSSQIGAAAGTLRMATHQGDSATATAAKTLLDNLLATRVRLAHYARDQYDAGKLTPLTMRIDADGVVNHDDIFKYNDVGELIPLEGDRNRTSDTRQLIWSSGVEAETYAHSSAGFMHYPALAGYSPLYPELAERLRRDLLEETRRYVQSYEVSAPWWWMADLAHHTTAGGEHLWESPTLSHDLFQVKARVLREDWETLRHQLPLPMTINPRYDLYRLHNLATLLSLSGPSLEASSLGLQPFIPRQGADITVNFTLINTGGPIADTAKLTFTLPEEMQYVADSGQAVVGSFSASGNTVTWTGMPAERRQVPISIVAHVQSAERRVVHIDAQLDIGATPAVSRSITITLNGYTMHLTSILN